MQINNIPGALEMGVKFQMLKDATKREAIALLRNEKGLTTLEYAVLFVLVVGATVGVWRTVGNKLVEELMESRDAFDTGMTVTPSE
jgi:Flp pilus assembly pilin Flp